MPNNTYPKDAELETKQTLNRTLEPDYVGLHCTGFCKCTIAARPSNLKVRGSLHSEGTFSGMKWG